MKSYAGRITTALPWLFGVSFVLATATDIGLANYWGGHLRAAVASAIALAVCVGLTRLSSVVGALAVAVLLVARLAATVVDRQYPTVFGRLGAGGLGNSLEYPSVAELLAVALLGAAFGYERSSPRARVVAGAGLLGALTIAPRVTDGFGAWSFTLAVVAGWLVALLAGLYVRSLSERQAVTVGKARVDERLDIARELHDLVAHHVTGIVVRAQAAQLGPNLDGPTRQAFAEIEAAGGDAMRSMRAMVQSLRNPDADAGADTAPQQPLEELRRLATGLASAGPRVEVRLGQALDVVSEPVLLAASRIATEAVTNSRRHAREATNISVDVDVRAGNVVVEVADDGRPTTASTGGFGITGMRERAVAFGGSLQAGPGPAVGWRVRANIPVSGQ